MVPQVLPDVRIPARDGPAGWAPSTGAGVCFRAAAATRVGNSSE